MYEPAKLCLIESTPYIMHYSEPHYGGLLRCLCIIGPPVSQPPKQHDTTNTVI